MQKTEREYSADVIDKAPEDGAGENDSKVLENYERLIADLQSELAGTKAEYARLKQQNELDTVRANLMRPYANKVFNFLVAYGVIVAIILLLDGFRARTGFALSDTIAGIVAGSTAVSAIGLVGWVVQGIFGITKAKS